MSDEIERVTDTRTLKPGDVVYVDVPITDKFDGTTRVWRRFACVVKVPQNSGQIVGIINLKLQIDDLKDKRVIDLRNSRERIYKIPESRWPQGIVSMRMKLIMTKKITLD